MPRPPLPLQLVRAAAARLRDAVALRTAPPVVTAVRRQGLTRLAPSVLAELHDLIVAAEQGEVRGIIVVMGDPGGGVAVVAADARSSAREVRVANVADPEAVAASLTRHGFRPEATRVSLHDGLPDAEGDAVAVAFVGEREPEVLRATVAALSRRLAPGGVLMVDASAPARLAAVEAGLNGVSAQTESGAWLHVVRP